MKSAYDRVKEYLERQGLQCYEDKKHGALQVLVTSHHGSWSCMAQVDEERHVFSFYSVLPIRIRKNKRANVAELITRVNHGLLLGNFELDFEEGEVRYRSSIPLYNGLSEENLHHLIITNVHTVDRYWDSLMTVTYSDCSPEEAFSRSQRSEEEPVFDFESCR